MNTTIRLFIGLVLLAASAGVTIMGGAAIAERRDTIVTVPFQSGTAVGFGYREALEALLAEARARPERKLYLTGHTAGGGDPVAEEELGLDRAQKVAADLIALGIDRQRVTLQSAGGTRPIIREAGETDAQLRARQGRVVIELSAR
jgi:outer membrane protein OmpA-like peptidoglycan-associated protein